MKNRLLLCGLAITLAITSCTKIPAPPEIKPPTPGDVAEPKPSEPTPSTSPIELNELTKMAEQSALAKYKWKDRSVAPKGYLKGMVLVYARSVCNPHPLAAKATLGSTDRDALAHYGLAATNKNLYALILGLGMRESSGKYCTGRDGSASNIASDTAEGGLLQTSYDSRGADSSLTPFFKNYNSKCFLEVFQEGVSCPSSQAKNWGTGVDGLAFQEKMKKCPAFAVEYTAIGMRVLRKHWGPINRKEVEFRPEALTLLTQVESYVKANPEICKQL